MDSEKIKTAAITVSDYNFFPGTLATVNSLLHYHDNLDVYVIDNGLTEVQRSLLASGGVTLRPAREFADGGRHIGAWELKAYAASRLAEGYDVLLGIDSDCVICAPVSDMIARCAHEQRWMGGRDGEGQVYGEEYAVYGIAPGSVNEHYMSTALYFCPVSERSRSTLNRWADCCAAAVFNGRGPFAGHGDQGVLNAILFDEYESEAIALLENALWSQHWVYWDSIIQCYDGQLLNCAAGRRHQRALHCGGTEKFWLASHRDRLLLSAQNQIGAYAWFLAMLWFGRCRDWAIDPDLYLPATSRHLIHDLVNFFHVIATLLPSAIQLWEPTDPLLERAVDGIRRAMSFGTSLSEYIAIAKRLGPNARLVEVGSCEGGSIVPVAISLLGRDVVCFAVESFTGNLDGTLDGHALPVPKKSIENVHLRFPHLPLISVPAASPSAAHYFANSSLDMVFLDACHTANAVAADIAAWLPKLKRGGLMAGDDWSWDGVRAAVSAVFGEINISPSGAVWSVRV